jgi:hypothetical protein
MYIELESNSKHDSARLVLHGAIGPSELAPGTGDCLTFINGIPAIDENAFENARCEENSILFSISEIAHRRHVPTCHVQSFVRHLVQLSFCPQIYQFGREAAKRRHATCTRSCVSPAPLADLRQTQHIVFHGST